MAGMMRAVAGLMVSLSAPVGLVNSKSSLLRKILLVEEATTILIDGLETWKVCSLVAASTCLEACGFGGLHVYRHAHACMVVQVL